MAIRIDGKALAAKVKARAAEGGRALSRRPGLAAVSYTHLDVYKRQELEEAVDLGQHLAQVHHHIGDGGEHGHGYPRCV